MSTDTTPDRLKWLGLPEGVRFRPRDEPPEPLFGPPDVNYPARDGRPRADDTLHFDWISKIKGGLNTLFRDDPDVFVAANLMWYPVEGNNRRRLAPDAMVAFGRPKGHRESYVQPQEAGIPPHVVFEILSPGNRKRVMDYKRKIYEMYGVEEYYVLDPCKIRLEVWLREGDAFQLMDGPGWVSPRLGIRFELGEDMTIFAPDGRPFLSYAEVARERDELERRSGRYRRVAKKQRRIVVQERERVAVQERRLAEAERQRFEAEHQRAERMAARLRELGLEPDE